MLLMIDNYDSFTYNLVQYFGELGEDVRVVRNDEIAVDEIAALAPERICISPGPCSPTEAGVSLAVIERFAGHVPILGDSRRPAAAGQPQPQPSLGQPATGQRRHGDAGFGPRRLTPRRHRPHEQADGSARRSRQLPAAHGGGPRLERCHKP